MTVNRQIWLSSRPTGIPQAENFGLREVEVPALEDGQFLVKNIYLSVDPALRGWITDTNNYTSQIQIGETMRGVSAGEVVESRHSDYAVGDQVMGLFGWQDYRVATGPEVWRKVTQKDIPLSVSLGVLGLVGLTAYFGLLDVGKPKAGETVVVSTAAGGVGSAVGQIAKIKGCRVVGVAGGPEKVRQCLEEFGYDAAIDYKEPGDLEAKLKAACPDGIDVYFDNTSGPIHDAVLKQINIHARIIICGTATFPNWDPWNDGPRPERHLLVKRATMQGFLTTDYISRFGEAVEALAGWIREGKLHYREDMREGIEAAPGAIDQLYTGKNNGKLLIRL